MCVDLSLYLLVGLLLGHVGRYKAGLARENMSVQIQRGNMITYRGDKNRLLVPLMDKAAIY